MIVIDKGLVDIFQYPKDVKDAVVITTNGMTRNNGAAVMGAGIALSAKNLFYGIDELLGSRLRNEGNHSYCLGTWELSNRFGNIKTYVMTLPTKNDWRGLSDISLIQQSCKELTELVSKYNVSNVYMPAPGCSNGGLKWCSVMPVISGILDDRFNIILSYEQRRRM